MKKITSLVTIALALVLSLSLVACKKSGTKTKIGIIQFMEHNSLATIEKAIESELATLGYTSDNAEIILKNGSADATQLAQIVSDYIDQGVDIVIPIATGAALAAVAAADKKIPVVFAAVSDPVGVGLVNALDDTSSYVTGVSNAIAVRANMDLAVTVSNPAKIGFIYTSSEANAASTVNKAKAYCDQINLPYEVKILASTSEIADGVSALLASGCEALFLPNDNTLAASGPLGQLSTLALNASIPLYAAVDSEVEDGAFLCKGITYSDLGVEVARMADKILKGTSVASVPVEVMDTNLKIFCNATVERALSSKITIPDSVKNDPKFTYVTEKNS